MTTNRIRYDAGAPHAPAAADAWGGAISDDVDALNAGGGGGGSLNELQRFRLDAEEDSYFAWHFFGADDPGTAPTTTQSGHSITYDGGTWEVTSSGLLFGSGSGVAIIDLGADAVDEDREVIVHCHGSSASVELERTDADNLMRITHQGAQDRFKVFGVSDGVVSEIASQTRGTSGRAMNHRIQYRSNAGARTVIATNGGGVSSSDFGTGGADRSRYIGLKTDTPVIGFAVRKATE